MAPLRIAINGFGRIADLYFVLPFHRKDLQILAVNDLVPAITLLIF